LQLFYLIVVKVDRVMLHMLYMLQCFRSMLQAFAQNVSCCNHFLSGCCICYLLQ
jgi:hypothetical protein